jgi:hypothetical protein
MALGAQVKAPSARIVRLRILITVCLNLVIALVLTGGLVWLAGRPGLRHRVDLTINQENTLDENARAIIDQLPGPVEIDVFFRPFGPPLEAIGAQIQGRMFEILILAEEYAPDKIKLTNHPYAPPGAGGAELMAEMQRLGISESNLFVVSYGDRRVAMKLLGEVAEIDLGNPTRRQGAYRPPSLVSFTGLQSLVKGLLRVTQGEKPLILFTSGQGERAIFESEDRDLGKLHTALVADGFRVEKWDPSEDGAIPEECAGLAIIGPEEPFSVEATGWIAEYVRGGGSIIAAPGLRLTGGQGSVTDILSRLGIIVQPGIICQPVINAAGMPVFESPKCAEVILRSDGMRTTHPITEPLRRGDRRVRLIFSHGLERGTPPREGILLDILRTTEYTWEEFPNEDGSFGWRWDQGREREGPFTVAMTSTFPPTVMGPVIPGTNSLQRECRVLALGTPEAFVNALFDVNRDFLINSFNWASEREFRVSVSPRKLDDRRIAVGQDRTLFYLNLIAIWGLPLLCLGLGGLAAWRRRR